MSREDFSGATQRINAANRVGDRVPPKQPIHLTPHRARPESAGDGLLDRLSDATRRVAETLQSAGGSVSDASRSAYLRSRATARDVKSGVSTGASSTASVAKQAAVRGNDKFQNARYEYPLGVGLGFFALGVVAGLVAPRTKCEDDWLGEKSDQLRDQARQAAQQAKVQATSQGRAAFADIKSTATQAVDQRGLTQGGLVERAKQIVTDVKDAALASAAEQGLTPEQLKRDAQAIAAETQSVAASHAEQAKQTMSEQVAQAKAQAQSVQESAQAKVDAKVASAKSEANRASQTVRDMKATANDLKTAADAGVNEFQTKSPSVDDGGNPVDGVSDGDMRVAEGPQHRDSKAIQTDDNWSDENNSVS